MQLDECSPMRAVIASLLSYDLQPESLCNPGIERACSVTMEQILIDSGHSNGDAIEDCTVAMSTASMSGFETRREDHKARMTNRSHSGQS